MGAGNGDHNLDLIVNAVDFFESGHGYLSELLEVVGRQAALQDDYAVLVLAGDVCLGQLGIAS